MHAHTGCFFIECTLCDETELWVFGAGPPPRFDEQRRPRFRPGQTLGGFVRPVGDATETMQRDLEASACLADFDVFWADLPPIYPSMRRWFGFKADAALMAELLVRLRGFAATRCPKS